MECELQQRIVVEKPPTGVVFGLQLGKGTDYETIQKQIATADDLTFECTVRVNDRRNDGSPNFFGPLTHGPPADRFIYIDIGKLAGQTDSPWERRIKVPLNGITRSLIKGAAADPNGTGSTIARNGKDGGPSCATILPSHGWQLIRGNRARSGRKGGTS